MNCVSFFVVSVVFVCSWHKYISPDTAIILHPVFVLPIPGKAKAKAMPGRLYIHTRNKINK
jgi:hypothetical protein